MEGLPPFKVIEPQASHSSSIIFLHGLGHSNATWHAAMHKALASQLPHTMWIFPQAPTRYVSMYRSEHPAWFDVHQLPPGNDEFDESAVEHSIALVERFILWQVHCGIDPKRIVLAGFSQGAATSMLAALTSLHDLAGVASLSGWLPTKALRMLHSAPTTPILWCHGGADKEIPLSMASDGLNALCTDFKMSSALVTFRVYDSLKHKLCDDELKDFGIWLNYILQ
ncbi:hypothetical protein PC9H_004048 [Pleurotus ostreatus]|uniref:Acyl-protein thioesterase 1 n=1 Tax=Pleurotus ostreatus TaxID=5322 RepID=A0A8H7DVV4_PLEOS|nr:uncharacterized protein PC9H_004048 [Pleurotus ostreatus]KAF7437212.1 hypothetical protein PC9H_004048 [Pleurotus ostreatus]